MFSLKNWLKILGTPGLPIAIEILVFGWPILGNLLEPASEMRFRDPESRRFVTPTTLIPHGNLWFFPTPQKSFRNRLPKNQLFNKGSTLAIHMADLKNGMTENRTFIRPCLGNRNQFLTPKYFPRAPQKFQLPHAICGSGVLIFGGRGGILRTIVEASSYKSRIWYRMILHFGLI